MNKEVVVEKYAFITDEIKFKNNLNLVDLSCQICGDFHHFHHYCPLIRYSPSSFSLDLNQQIKNLRKKLKRERSRHHSLQIWQLREKVDSFRQKNMPQLEQYYFDNLDNPDTDSDRTDTPFDS